MQSNNKRIAKNAIMLTLRSLLVAIVGLYTSRIVLEALGVDDYGIYGVIGGIVGLASFLNTSMAGATSRFITFELGTGDREKLKNIFATSLRIHFFIALIVMILAETIGLWFLNNKMVIPENRMFAANVLYQFTILSVLVSFTQVPYNAAIIAHEKMNIYAYFEIIFVILKLVIVYILLLVDNSRLILYGSLTFGVTVINALFYRGYCIRHFQETKLTGKFSKELAKPMLSFSGFDMYGNMCVGAKTQGQPIVLNLFYGVVANAAASIALTVSGTLVGLTTTISQAFKPQIIKQYAANNLEEMSKLMRRSTQFVMLGFACLAIPFIIETPAILKLWLGQIPPYSVEFIRIIFIAQFADIVIRTNNTAIHATGNIKKISFISGTFYLLCPVISYVWLNFGGPAISIYIIDAIMFTLIALIGWSILNAQISQVKWNCYIWGCLKSTGVILFTLPVVYLLMKQIYPDEVNSILGIFVKIIISFSISFLILVVTSYFLAFNNLEREFVAIKIKSFIKRLKPA